MSSRVLPEVRFYRWLILILIVAGAIAIGLLARPRRPEATSVGDFARWAPTAAEIRTRVGRGPAGIFTDKRHRLFRDLFKQRYREERLAIGLRFEDDSRIKLMFGALIPRWDMARVAVALQQESHDDFGRPKSHGCVNLPPDAARELFDWIDPPLPDGWYVVNALPSLVPGTVVVIAP